MAQKLLDKSRETARLKHLSIRTEKAYLQWIHPVRYYFNNICLYYKFVSHGIKRFILFHHKRRPAEMGELEIRSFLDTPRCCPICFFFNSKSSIKCNNIMNPVCDCCKHCACKRIFHSQDYQLEDGVNIFRTICQFFIPLRSTRF